MNLLFIFHRERREKVNITFHPENSTVSFDQKRTWFFDEARSNGSLNDMVTQLNVVALVSKYGFMEYEYASLNSLDITEDGIIIDLVIARRAAL